MVSVTVNIARCPEHGLHGARTECFVCSGPVEQVPMVPLHDVVEALREALVERLGFRWLRAKAELRCALGVHRLRAWRAPDGGPNACPMNPRSLPGPGDRRRCDHCGAHWEGAYDGMAPFWRRTR